MNIKYKEMIVWSEGKKAKRAKLEIIFQLIAFIAIIIFTAIILYIARNTIGIVNNAKFKDGIMYYSFFLGLLGVICLSTATTLLEIKKLFKRIKSNKMIPLYLFDINEFIKIGKIPEDKFILFSDKTGAVLAMKKYETESKNFCNSVRHFYEFKDYYYRNAVDTKSHTSMSYDI